MAASIECLHPSKADAAARQRMDLKHCGREMLRITLWTDADAGPAAVDGN